MLNYGIGIVSGCKVRPGSINLSTNAPAQAQLSEVLSQRMVETVTRTAPDFDLKPRQACEGIATCRKGKI